MPHKKNNKSQTAPLSELDMSLSIFIEFANGDKMAVPFSEIWTVIATRSQPGILPNVMNKFCSQSRETGGVALLAEYFSSELSSLVGTMLMVDGESAPLEIPRPKSADSLASYVQRLAEKTDLETVSPEAMIPNPSCIMNITMLKSFFESVHILALLKYYQYLDNLIRDNIPCKRAFDDLGARLPIANETKQVFAILPRWIQVRDWLKGMIAGKIVGYLHGDMESLHCNEKLSELFPGIFSAHENIMAAVATGDFDHLRAQLESFATNFEATMCLCMEQAYIALRRTMPRDLPDADKILKGELERFREALFAARPFWERFINQILEMMRTFAASGLDWRRAEMNFGLYFNPPDSVACVIEKSRKDFFEFVSGKPPRLTDRTDDIYAKWRQAEARYAEAHKGEMESRETIAKNASERTVLEARLVELEKQLEQKCAEIEAVKAAADKETREQTTLLRADYERYKTEAEAFHKQYNELSQRIARANETQLVDGVALTEARRSIAALESRLSRQQRLNKKLQDEKLNRIAESRVRAMARETQVHQAEEKTEKTTEELRKAQASLEQTQKNVAELLASRESFCVDMRTRASSEQAIVNDLYTEISRMAAIIRGKDFEISRNYAVISNLNVVAGFIETVRTAAGEGRLVSVQYSDTDSSLTALIRDVSGMTVARTLPAPLSFIPIPVGLSSAFFPVPALQVPPQHVVEERPRTRRHSF